MSVTARLEPLVIPTYPVGTPEKNPVFFEKRVSQGSSGKDYPVPFIDKVFDEPVDTTYQSALLENEFVRLVILPEIGGRIFVGQDKTNNDYDFFYRQDVIKPALVGLAGPWISGGVEFNWPQHHRPGTFLPADVHIEEESDGARTVWLSEHDPINRLKGMHGVRLRPGSSLVELRVRLYNRTPFTHTFLWWANVAAKVHDRYQSFFPTDVHYVADHAVRATSSFPIADNPYYDIPYQDRPGENDLSWYKNIPVPTSYMVCQTDFDFFGGYDFAANGGFVHVANRHIAPGKKQWTWGNDEFGWAWDRELTDDNGPYVELMAGVYTDNQPDFTYLHPYETKTFSQFWWPIQDIGPVQQANKIAALACEVRADRMIALGLCVSEPVSNARLTVAYHGSALGEFDLTLTPGESWQDSSLALPGENPAGLEIHLLSETGDPLLSYLAIDTTTLTRDRPVATEPAAPEDITSTDELYFTGEHLDQYRHPTRDPECYWNECLKRDPGDARCHSALGKRALNRGEFVSAHDHFQQAVARLTHRHPNPVTGEAHYYLGLTLRKLDDQDNAYAALYKATWDYAWRACAYYQLATIDCLRHDWSAAIEHLDASLDTNRQNNKAHVLKALVLQQVAGAVAGASSPVANTPTELLNELLRTDPLDHWARHALEYVAGVSSPVASPPSSSFLAATRNDAQTILDLVFDYAEAGFYQHAIDLLELHHSNPTDAVAVPNPMERSAMTHYALAWFKSITHASDAGDFLASAHTRSPDHFFPSRLEEIIILQWAVAGASSPVANTFTPTYLDDSTEIARYKNQLPHWSQNRVTYAVTFRLADSLAQSVVQAYLSEKQFLQAHIDEARKNNESTKVRDFEKQLQQLYRNHIESALDQGAGDCHMHNPEVAKIVSDAITHFDGDRYDLAAWCVMPNHVHLIIRPHKGHSLINILASIKSFSAQQANKVLKRSGNFWQSESYDHIIRDEEDFFNQLDYLKRNPEKAGISDWNWIGSQEIELATGLEAPATVPDTACYALGNYYFDKHRHADAIAVWEKAVAAGTTIPQVYRNLGIAYWNHGADGEKAAAYYQRALDLDPADPRLVSESDQLAAKRNRPVGERLGFLENHLELVRQRDDATVGLASLYNLAGKPQRGLDLVTSRKFHPWEGGEGAVLRQYTTAHILLGRQALDEGDAATALDHFTRAMDTPESLGEAYHPLQAKADVNYWLGRALADLGRHEDARNHFQLSAKKAGDFSAMAVTAHSPLSYYRGLSLRELGKSDEANHVFNDLLSFAEKGLEQTARIDYFATSLPNLLVFDEDMQQRSDAENHLLIAMASHGLGDTQKARKHLARVLNFCCDNQHAVNLLPLISQS